MSLYILHSSQKCQYIYYTYISFTWRSLPSVRPTTISYFFYSGQTTIWTTIIAIPSVARNCHICSCSAIVLITQTHHHHHTFNGPLSRTTRVSQYQKSRTNLDFTRARDTEWQWHQLGHMQVCISLQRDNHTSVLQARCPSCRPTNSIKALKAILHRHTYTQSFYGYFPGLPGLPPPNVFKET